MPPAGLTLPVREPFDAGHLLAFLAARAIPGVEELDGWRYRRTLALARGPAIAEVELRRGEAEVRLLEGDSRDLSEAGERFRRVLDLDADVDAVRAALGSDPLLAPLVAARPGLRSPGAADRHELVVRAVVGQQVSVAAARTILGRLAERHGERIGSMRVFPPPERLAALDPTELPMPQTRAQALVAACSVDPADRPALVAIRGIGEWTAAYVAMRALGDRDAFLPTDLGIRRALERLGEHGDPAAVAERWRPWRAYAAHHLWATGTE